jgi:2-polyprenyl-6-methoxyphenol hydroxylase-like FAD-dependent oxidoreductase
LQDLVKGATTDSADPGDTVYDDIIIGTGMAGLTVGALLALQGHKVLMLEAHDQPGATHTPSPWATTASARSLSDR